MAASRAKRRVGDLMNPSVVCVPSGATVAEAQKLLAERAVSGAPVVDAQGRPIGVISQSDLTRAQSSRTTVGEAGRFYTDVADYRDLLSLPLDRSNLPVDEVMTPRVYSVTRDTGVAAAANVMRERHIHRLLVTERGVLVGVLSSFDLLRVVEELG
jgi:CBS domain-containing protein